MVLNHSSIKKYQKFQTDTLPTFDSKSQVLNFILNKKYPESKEYSNIASDFPFIAKERNMLAHYFLDESENASELLKTGSFVLLKIENKRTQEIFDFQRIKKLGDLVQGYIELLGKITD